VRSVLARQVDVLCRYFGHHDAVVALEFPTVAVRTVPAPLIVERRAQFGRGVFVCPTVKLVCQVQAVATRQDRSTLAFVGAHNEWPPQDSTEYTAGDLVAVEYIRTWNENES
jgi:hypothetical protein